MSQEIVSVHSGELVSFADEVRYLPVWDEVEKVRAAVALALEAPSIDAAMDVDDVRDTWQSHVGEQVIVHGAHLAVTDDTTKARPFYGVYDMEFSDGKRERVFCGSVQPLAIANRAAFKGEFPFMCNIVEGIKPASGGNAPCLFARVKAVKGEGSDKDF